MASVYFSPVTIYHPMKKLKDKIALITGASRGIGKAIALQLASEGVTILAHYGHDDNAAKSTATEIENNGSIVHLIKADLSSLNNVRGIFQQVDALLGNKKLDILINNAGILYRAGLHEITETDFDKQIAINVKAPFFITREAILRMNDGGRIINISSQVSKRPRYGVGAYAMTKAAIDNFTVSLAKELGKRKITVNAVAPGFIDTDMNKDVLTDDKARATIAAKAALNRMGTPTDIASVVTFLASEEGGWITGQCIEASGGAGLF
jgi:3-oxoacyl-[acyl-carrier protein] reductase